MVSHSALNIGTLRRALGHDEQTQQQHLRFFHDSFGLFELKLLFVCQICHVNCESEN